MNRFFSHANADERKILTELFRRNTNSNPGEYATTLSQALSSSAAMLREILAPLDYPIYVRHLPPVISDGFALDLTNESPLENGKRNFKLLLSGRFADHAKLLAAAEKILGALPFEGEFTLSLYRDAEFGVSSHQGAIHHLVKIPLALNFAGN